MYAEKGETFKFATAANVELLYDTAPNPNVPTSPSVVVAVTDAV